MKRIRPVRRCCQCLEMRPHEAFDMCRRCYRRCYDRETADRRKAEKRAHYARHRERVQAKNRAYYHANRERCRAQQREYRNRGGATTSHGSALLPVPGWGYAGA